MAIYQIYGWRDLRTSLTAAATGAGTPSLQPFGPDGNVKQRRFGIGDSVYLACHWDHDVARDTLCHVHVHYAVDGVDVNPVAWEINYTQAKGHDQESFSADNTITLSQAPRGIAWQHMVVEDAVGFTIPEADTLTILELKRISNGATDNTDQVFGLFVDFHYQSGPFYGTRNRSPDFYE